MLQLGICYGNSAPHYEMPKIEQILERADHTCASPNSTSIILNDVPNGLLSFFARPMNALDSLVSIHPFLIIVGYYQ